MRKSRPCKCGERQMYQGPIIVWDGLPVDDDDEHWLSHEWECMTCQRVSDDEDRDLHYFRPYNRWLLKA